MHIQGFIAGILVAAIALTGLYYGTEGQFFKGSTSLYWTLVTDANFEDEVIKSELPVFLLFYKEWNEPSRKLFCALPWYEIAFYDGFMKFALVYADRSPGVVAQCSVKDVPTCVIFRDGELVSRKTDLKTDYESLSQLWEWLRSYCR